MLLKLLISDLRKILPTKLNKAFTDVQPFIINIFLFLIGCLSRIIYHDYNVDSIYKYDFSGGMYHHQAMLLKNLIQDGKQGLERYFRPDACMLGIPKPFVSHFVWAARFYKTLITPFGHPVKNKKVPEPDIGKTDIWLRDTFLIFYLLTEAALSLLRCRHRGR